MKIDRNALQKLIAAASKASPAPPTESPSQAPFAFTARVAGRWTQRRGRPPWPEAWERLCWWGASVSTAVCLLAFLHQSLQRDLNPLDVLVEADGAIELR